MGLFPMSLGRSIPMHGSTILMHRSTYQIQCCVMDSSRLTVGNWL